MSEIVRPTTIAHLFAGPVECRLDRCGDAVVAVFHGGYVRAGLPMGEDVFTAAGCTVLAPSRTGYGRTPLSTGTSVQVLPTPSGTCEPASASRESQPPLAGPPPRHWRHGTPIWSRV